MAVSDFQIDHPNPRVRAQQTLAAAIYIKNHSDISGDDVERVIDAADSVSPPAPFLVALALLRRPSAEPVKPYLSRVLALALTESTNKEFFLSRESRDRLALAIRGDELDRAPGSWWLDEEDLKEQVGKGERIRRFDRQSFERWMIETVKWDKNWGIPLFRFSSSI